MLSIEDSLVLLVDIQDRLVASLDDDKIITKSKKIVESAKILGIPVLITEQYPKGLGNTVEELKKVLPFDACTVEKTYFNALLEEGFLEKIKSYNKKQIIIFGIETHICVYQTACALVEEGYEVYVIKDACASRNKYEFELGIEVMLANGVKVSSVEILLFEWLKGSKHPKFKEIQTLVKV